MYQILSWVNLFKGFFDKLSKVSNILELNNYKAEMLTVSIGSLCLMLKFIKAIKFVRIHSESLVRDLWNLQSLSFNIAA